MTMPWSKFIDKKDAAKIYWPYSNEYVQKLANWEETLVSAKSSPENKKNVSVDELKSKFPNQTIGTTQPTITPSAVQKIASLQWKTDATIWTVNIDKTSEFIKNEDIKRENLLKEDSIKWDVARLEKNIPYVWSKIAWGVSDFMKRWAGKILWVDFDEAWKQATETQVMQDKLTLSSPELISAANNIKNIVKGTYAESLVQSPEIEFETSPEWYLARTKSAAADRWNKTIIKYWNKMWFDWDEVEFTDTKQVNVANLFNNKWLSNDWKTIFLNNWNTTIELPVIETTDYKELVSDAYNWVTNRLTTEWVLTTPDELRKFYPEWEDVSDDELNRFINACGYDVQEWKRRDINEYYENFKDMAFTESYTSQNDNMIQLLSNETFQNYWAWMFIWWVEKLEWITGKELQEYIYAASQLSARAEVIKSKWYAPDWASDYAILSTYSRQYPELKKILNTYNKYKLSEKDFAELTYTYSKNMQDTEDFVTKVTWASTKELKDIWKREARAQITKYTSEISNAWVKEQVTNDTWFKYGAKIPILWSMIVWNYYKVGNKYFDLDWNEMKPSEAEMSFADKWLNSLIWLWSNLNELEIDYQTYRDTWEWEYLWASASDAISASFNWMMAFTPWWLKFYAKTYIPFYWEMLEWWMWTAMEFLWDAWVFLTDYAWITQWRTAENKDKLRDAFGWLTFMLLEHYRAKLKWTILEKYRDKTAIKKWIDAMKNKFEETIKMYDLMWEMSKWQHKPDIEKQEETIKQIDEELKTKIEEINKRADMPEDVKKDEIKRAQEEAKIKKDQAKNTQKYLKETEQEENKKIDKEVTQWKLEFTKEFFKNLVTEFNNAFREEYSKNRKASEAGERSENSILDALYKSLIDRTNALQEIRTRESRGTAEKTGEKTAQENVPAELPTAEQVTTETAQESTKQTSISEQKIETPETRVEVTGEKPSEEIKWTVTTEWESEQVKQQINSIADVIKKIVDESQKMFVKMLDWYISILDATSPYANKIWTAIWGTTWKIAKKISNRQTEVDMKKDYNAMIEMWLDESQIDIIQNNPYTPALIRIAKEKYWPSKYDPKKIVKKWKTSTDEIQRDVLSEWVKQIQEYINFLIKNKKEISRVYKELSKDGIIDVKEFVNSPEFKEILKNTNIDVEFRMRETEKWELRMWYQAFSKDWQKLNVNEQAAADYLEEMFNKHIWRRNISENEAQSIRSFFTSDWDWNKTWKFDKWIAKNLHHAWNQYIEKQWWVELLRKIDKAFNDFSDKLEMFEDMLDKDNNIKDSVKTKMFEWSETEISEMETIVPWIWKLIELAKASPDIVNKIIDSALKTKKTRQWIAQPVRYTFVALPSIFWWIKFWLPWLIAGSFVFKRSEMLWWKLSNLITWKTPDLKDLNRLVDALNVDESTKSQYKRQMQEDFEELSKIFQDKNEAEINQIWQEITDIQLEREARRIAEEQAEIDRINKLKSEIEQAEQEKQAKEKAWQEELEKQKWSQAPRLWTQETHRLPQRENIQETPASVSEEWETIVSTPEWKNIVFKKWEDVRLDQISKTIIQASISPETESASPEAQKWAEILNRIQNNTADIMKDSVWNDVMEKWEAPTQENINKEASTATPSIEDFISEMEKWDTSSDKPTKPNFKKVSYNTLLQFFDKDWNVKPEFKEYEQELNEAMMYHESNRWSKGEFTSPATVKKRERKLKNVEERSNELDNLRESFAEDFGILEIGWVDDAYLDQEMWIIKHTSDADTGRWDSYNTMLAEEMLWKKPQGSVSYTSKLELIEQLPASKRKVNMLKTKWEKSKKAIEKQKIYKAYKKAEAEREEQKAKKKELAEQYKEQTKIQKDENSTTQERKTAQKKKEKLAKDFEDLTEAEEISMIEQQIAKERYEEEKWVDEFTVEQKNTEKSQVVSSENEPKTTQETKAEQEPTQQYNWRKWKENLKNFEEKFANEWDITETDEYWEAIGKTKYQKIREYITESFWKLERWASAMSEEIYDERTAKTKEIWNWTISTKDIWLKYSTKPEDISDKTQSKNAKATFNAEEVTMAFGSREKALIPHEYAHAMDYKFSKELWIWWVTLSEFIDMMIEWWEDMSWVFGENAPIISKFTELFKKIKEQWSDVNPAELFARFGEWFVQRAEWKTIETSYWEKFSPELYEEFVNWLWELDNARVNWKLQNWQIQPGEFKWWKDFKVVDITDPILKSDIEDIKKKYKISWDYDLELLKKINKKAKTYPEWSTEQQELYNIKERMIFHRLDELDQYVMNRWKPGYDKDWNPKWTFVPLEQETTWDTIYARPHMWWSTFWRWIQEWRIISRSKFNKRKESQKNKGNS